MRVSQLMFGKGFGGAERSFIDLSIALAERGVAVQAVCHSASRAAQVLAQHPQIDTRHVNVIGVWDLWASWRLRRLLGDFQPQLVHAHLARAAHLGGRAVRPLGLPLLAKTHTYVNLKYYRAVEFFVATTEDQKAYLLDRGIHPDHIEVVPNFSRIQPVPVRPSRHSGAPQILSFGRLVPKKGFDVLLRAVRELQKNGYRIEVSIGGDGPERGRLERLCQRLDLQKTVRFTGWIEDVADALKQADVFVLPSREEPFGIALLEAMAMGTPIVSTLSDGPRQILSEATAFLAAPDDVGALTKALREALGETEECVRRAQTAQQEFRDHYAVGPVVAQYVAIYEHLCRQHSIE